MRLPLLLHVTGALLSSSVVALWPLPRSMSTGSTFVRLDSTFQITLVGTLTLSPPEDLQSAANRAHYQIETDRFQRLVVGRGEEDRPTVESATLLSRLELSLHPASPVLSIADEVHKSYEDKDESCMLSIDVDDAPTAAGLNQRAFHLLDFGGAQASLTANTTLGLLRGLQTFTQLVYTLPGERAERYIPDTPVRIEDAPAFPHRAFMLDTSRHFFPVSESLRTLDTMASVKLSVFHWHVVDSQSWPLFVPAFPELSDTGAYSLKEAYTPEDIAHVEAYAASLGIEVVLELDMPGHTASIASSHPEHIACKEASPWSEFAAEPPAGQLRLTNDTVAFSRKVVENILSMSKGRLFSTGGDEVNEACYAEDSTVGPLIDTTHRGLDKLLSTFVNGLHRSVRKAGKTPVVWEEMVLDHTLDLSNETIVLTWISSNHTAAVAEKGFRVIHASPDYFYLDCGLGSWLGSTPNGSSWCSFVSWQKSYSFDPFFGVSPSQHHLVLGGESLVWTEQVDSGSLDSTAWPRAAAAAEVFWTGGSLEDGTRDVSEALARLQDWRYVLSIAASRLPLCSLTGKGVVVSSPSDWPTGSAGLERGAKAPGRRRRDEKKREEEPKNRADRSRRARPSRGPPTQLSVSTTEMDETKTELKAVLVIEYN